MRLAISNIAWDIDEDEEMVSLLKKFSVDAIDIAPSKYFPTPAKASQADIQAVRGWWDQRGIEITGMQSLLFGTVGLNVFGPEDVQDALLEHLAAVCRIASGLGATRLVFGSPKNRDRTGLTDEQALTKAVAFFRRLGDIAEEHGTIICLEPNPTCYGANFMTTSEETARVVRSVAHSGIRMQLDTGALTINGESATTILRECYGLIGHVHISEPNLVPIGDMDTDHNRLHEALARYVPGHVASIEMVATKDEPHLVAIERALMQASKSYRPVAGKSV